MKNIEPKFFSVKLRILISLIFVLMLFSQCEKEFLFIGGKKQQLIGTWEVDTVVIKLGFSNGGGISTKGYGLLNINYENSEAVCYKHLHQERRDVVPPGDYTPWYILYDSIYNANVRVKFYINVNDRGDLNVEHLLLDENNKVVDRYQIDGSWSRAEFALNRYKYFMEFVLDFGSVYGKINFYLQIEDKELKDGNLKFRNMDLSQDFGFQGDKNAISIKKVNKNKLQLEFF